MAPITSQICGAPSAPSHLRHLGGKKTPKNKKTQTKQSQKSTGFQDFKINKRRATQDAVSMAERKQKHSYEKMKVKP